MDHKLDRIERSHPSARTPQMLRRLAWPLSVLSILTIAGAGTAQHLHAQQLTTQAPSAAVVDNFDLPQAPSAQLSRAVPLPVPEDKDSVVDLESDQQERHGDIFQLTGNVVIQAREHILRADRVTYDLATGEVVADGHLTITGGDNDEFLSASHGNYNIRSQTGRFYDVSGSTGVRSTSRSVTYSSPNPFVFSGRMVVKTGPDNYVVYQGSVTSCLLPHPDWQLFAGRFVLDDKEARARDSTFRLLNIPILFLPYVTHPTDANARQSGLLIPDLGQSSTKGLIVGEQYFLVLGRSADLTLGTQYFSLRGWSESGTFRYRGFNEDFFTGHFSALQDRGYTPTGGIYTNQGGEDVTAAFRRAFTQNTRLVGDAEYLSSYVYREAFTDNFNQAVSSDISSIVYLVTEKYGYSFGGRADRYQGLKQVPIQTATGFTSGQEVHILHTPSLDFNADDHAIPGTLLLWHIDGSIAGLKRAQPNFTSSGVIERVDFRPELSLPLAGGGWHTMTSVAARETFYSRSRATPYTPGQPPQELVQPLNRASLELTEDIRPPVIERTFTPHGVIARVFGPELRHTIEPELTYSFTTGIDNFLSVLRFDDVDIDSNTNQLEYGVTQRLFARGATPAATKLCPVRPGKSTSASAGAATSASSAAATAAALQPSTNAEETPADASDNEASDEAPVDPTQNSGSVDANGIPTPEVPIDPLRTHPRHAVNCPQPEQPQREWFSWRLAQRYFFDPNFGGAVINQRRNIFDSTLSLSGVAFLTEPRNISPLVSRLRVRTTDHIDTEWDFDLDTGAGKFTSSNVYVDAHRGPVFGGVSYARLNAPGRFYTIVIDQNNDQSLVGSAISNFSQLRLLLGYGTPAKPGLSLAANMGIDLNLGAFQYAALQANYNWNCCGVAIEYRKYELGTVRNENAYRFNFTLANIGTAGNLRRTERLF